MKKNISQNILKVVVGLGLWHCLVATAAPSASLEQPHPPVGDRSLDALRRGFLRPPDLAKPATFWWWFNNYVSKEGITRDLEQFRAKGLGGVLLINTTTGFGSEPIPRGPQFLSAEWRELFRHALREASRLALEVGVNLSTGWVMGGPWIKPENSGRWVLQSTLSVVGPQKFSGRLPLPGNRSGYNNAGQLFVKNYVNLPLEQLDYRDTVVIAFPEAKTEATRFSGDRLKLLAAKSNRHDASSHVRAHEIMDPPMIPWSAAESDQPLRTSRVIDLTSKVGAAGRLEWEVPAGRWTILRTGHRMTGARTAYALPEAEGLEVDFLSEAGVEAQFEFLGKTILAEAGPQAGKTLKYFSTDSFEAGFPNWTAKILEKFRRSRGYDATPYLPVFSGYIVESAEVSDRFLYDYRQTVADCLADSHYGRFAELCHENGLLVQNESAGPNWSGTLCMDGLKNLGRSDRPMGEFWQNNNYVYDGQNQVCKMVASAAHIYGKRTASAEAFTTMDHWSDDPAALKPVADRAFCEGINHLIFHTSTATRPEDGKPGYEYGAGTHFNPNITWWEQSGAFLDYLGRCQHLLQSGQFVADVLYYNGDGAPNIVRQKHVPDDLGPGYDYDVCNTEVLLTRLAVEDRYLVLPDGVRYRALVLPESQTMTVEVARKLRELARAGATIIGPKPVRAPGLKNYPQCDRELRAIAAELWGDCDGKKIQEAATGRGRMVWGKSVREILRGDGIPPDFQYPADTASLDFIHCSTSDAEFYFVVNRSNQPVRVACTFRIADRAVEIWNPVTGYIREASEFSFTNNCTVVPLVFAPYQSLFVVFRKTVMRRTAVVELARQNFPDHSSLQTLTGSWDVQFDPRWGGPASIKFEALNDWIERPEAAIQYYSGTATYRKRFNLNSEFASDQKLLLDLGRVKNLAAVRLNGVNLGVVWTAPWQVEITQAAKPLANLLEIDVVNLWPNRLIGDAALPPEKRFTRTNIPLKKNARLLSSGLLSPVTILSLKQ